MSGYTRLFEIALAFANCQKQACLCEFCPFAEKEEQGIIIYCPYDFDQMRRELIEYGNKLEKDKRS